MAPPLRDLKDAVRDRLKEVGGLTIDDRSRIALFIQSVKTANAFLLARVELQPLHWWAFKVLHDQYFKEVELASLLARTVQWTLNPRIYRDATRLTWTLWHDAGVARHAASPIGANRSFVEYLALSHAFMADIRFMPLLPVEWDFTEPFLFAVHEIEDENSRQIQAQIRLLKDMDAPTVPLAERERIVEQQRAIVDGLFGQFLQTLLPTA
jgi:hypothetical protein